MKKFLVVFMILGLVAGSIATADARKRGPRRTERTVEGSYAPPYVPPLTGCKSLLGPWACLIVQSRDGEAFFTAKVTDAHGQPLAVWYLAGSASGSFCGATPRPVAFDPGTDLEFRIGLDTGPLVDCPNRIKTVGTISVTLSNLP